MPKGSEMYDVMHIKQREGDKPPVWTKVGIGFRNRDDSINIYLDYIPQDYTLHIRKQRKPEKDPEQKTTEQE